MTKYAVLVGEQEYRVEVKDDHLVVNGEPIAFELTSLNGNGLHLFRRDTHNQEMYFKRGAEDAYEVTVAGQRLVAHVDAAHRAARRRQREDVAGEVKAPMPGLVVEVLVAEGETVDQNQVLVVQESMKMQMQLRAPCAGRIERLAVCAGDQVEKGAVLVRIAETPDACHSDG